MRTFLKIFFLPGLLPCFLSLSALGADPPSSTPRVISPLVLEGSEIQDPVVAVFGSSQVTLEEVDRIAAAALLDLTQQMYRQRRDTLDALIHGQLLQKEGEAQHVAPDVLLDREVADKAQDPADPEVEQFYKENQGTLQGSPLEAIAPRIREHLKAQKLEEAQEAYFAALRQKYGVRIFLERPRVQVSADQDASLGPAHAAVTIVVFTDYECPFCARGDATLTEIAQVYGQKVRIVIRDYPLAMHPNAQGAAEAAECAGSEGRFWEMHQQMFAHQDQLDRDGLIRLASAAGLNKKSFKSCLESARFKDEVRKDFEDGTRYGVAGTPMFFVNGIPLSGAQNLKTFAEIIDAELASPVLP